MNNFITKIKNSAGLKTGLAVFIGQIITQGIGFLTTPIFTRLMSVEEYGIITQYNACNSIISVLATLMLSGGVFQVAMNEFKDSRNSFTYSALVLSNMATIVVFSVIFAFITPFSSLLSLPLSLIILMFVYNLLNPAMNLWLCRQRYEYKYKAVLLVSVISTLVGQIVSVVCLLLVNNVNKGILKLWTSLVPSLIFALVLYFSIAKKEKFIPNKKYIKYAFTFNAPLLPHYFAQYALVSCNQLFITYYLGTEATAIYGLASTVAYMANVVWAAFSAVLTPYIYENLNIKKYKKINFAIIGVLLVYGVCCIGVAIVAPEVVFIMGSNAYSESILLIPPICASALLQAVYSNYSTIAFYHHKRISTAVMTVIAATLNIVLDILLIPRMGCIGAAYATEISYLTYVLLHFVNYKRIAGKDRIFNDNLIWGIVILVTIVCLAANFLYAYPFVRYTLILAFFMVALILRKRLFKFVKQLMLNKEGEENG